MGKIWFVNPKSFCRINLLLTFMYRYIDSSDDSFLQNDEIYQRIMKQLNPFISNLKSGEDEQLMLKMISECYQKYHESIKTRSQSDTELMLSTIMALLVEQDKD